VVDSEVVNANSNLALQAQSARLHSAVVGDDVAFDRALADVRDLHSPAARVGCVDVPALQNQVAPHGDADAEWVRLVASAQAEADRVAQEQVARHATARSELQPVARGLRDDAPFD